MNNTPTIILFCTSHTSKFISFLNLSTPKKKNIRASLKLINFLSGIMIFEELYKLIRSIRYLLNTPPPVNNALSHLRCFPICIAMCSQNVHSTSSRFEIFEKMINIFSTHSLLNDFGDFCNNN